VGGSRATLAALVMLAMLSTAASAQSTVQSPPDATRRLIDVPYLPQTAELCGGAALAMVMRYWGDRTVLPSDFQSLVKSPAGIATIDLIGAVVRRGWQAAASQAPPDTPLAGLGHEVDLGRPVIVLIEPSPGHFHYVVVVGVTRDRVVLHDPARTSFRVVAVDTFDREWRGSQRWQLVVLPPAGGVRVETERPPLGVSGLTAITQPRTGACGALVDHGVALADIDVAEAEQALRAASELCPTDADPWLELAGLRFRDSHWRESAGLAERAVRLAPTDQNAWALLATARFMDDDAGGALEAWNHLGEPSIDVVTITGARRSPQPALAHLIGLEPRTLLTRHAFDRAARRFGDAPTASATRLTFTPIDGGRATVSAAMAEREAWPHSPLDLAVVVGRALVADDLRVTLAGVAGQGETVSADWRWPSGRPRVGASLSLPAPAPLAGIVTINGFWEHQSYALPTAGAASTVVSDSRRDVLINLGTWLSGGTHIDVGVGIDRFSTDDYFVSHGAFEEHLAGDRLIARVDGTRWWLGAGGGFSSETAIVSWCSTPDVARASWSVTAGQSLSTASTPRALWMGAGTGEGRPLLLRAHPLLDANVISGPLFGRRIAFSTAEYQHPLRLTPAGIVGVAAFVDTARAWSGLAGPGASPLEVDAGVGLRLKVSQRGDTARIDVARGLRDGGTVLSIGWSSSIGTLLSGGM
jgi:predicted double-glycine peptidase